jgi:peptidyl-prolyl cis-trans isomerase C
MIKIIKNLKIKNGFAIISLFIVFILSGCTQKETIIATFKGGNVTTVEVETVFQQKRNINPLFEVNKFSELPDQTKRLVIQDIIVQKLIKDAAKKEKLYKDKEIREKIAKYTANLIKKEFLFREASKLVSEKEVKKRYERLAEQLKGREQVRARHILLKTEKEARGTLTLLSGMGSVSFETLAKKKSLDTTTASNGGDLGCFVKGRFLKRFEDKVFSMEKGEISGPVETKLGWHIIKLEDRKPAVAVPYEKVKDKVKARLIQHAIKEYIRTLLIRSEINIVENE